jgi:hypothetical protein
MAYPPEGIELHVVDGAEHDVSNPNQLVATVHVVFSKALLQERRDWTLDQVADDVRLRTRVLLDNSPENL